MSEFKGMLERSGAMDQIEEFWERRNTSNVMMHYAYSDDEYIQKGERSSNDSGAGFLRGRKNYDGFGKKRTSGISVDDPDYMYER